MLPNRNGKLCMSDDFDWLLSAPGVTWCLCYESDDHNVICIAPCRSYDLVVSCLNLHWVNDLPMTLLRLRCVQPRLPSAAQCIPTLLLPLQSGPASLPACERSILLVYCNSTTFLPSYLPVVLRLRCCFLCVQVCPQARRLLPGGHAGGRHAEVRQAG